MEGSHLRAVSGPLGSRSPIEPIQFRCSTPLPVKKLDQPAPVPLETSFFLLSLFMMGKFIQTGRAATRVYTRCWLNLVYSSPSHANGLNNWSECKEEVCAIYMEICRDLEARRENERGIVVFMTSFLCV